MKKSHAVLNIESRIKKAKKIDLLLKSDHLFNCDKIRILEIGCGSGGISYYFSNHKKTKTEVIAIDIQDNRQISDGYTFLISDGTKIPFIDNSFDLVITNHVIEHVGTTDKQISHLNEINRILKNQGICYLAVPNRWMIKEPHYQLNFLSWLPRFLRSHYLRLMKKGHKYDCEPLSKYTLEKMLKETNFTFQNMAIPATRVTFDLEKQKSISNKILRKLPDSFLKPFRPIIPTLVYIIRKRPANPS